MQPQHGFFAAGEQFPAWFGERIRGWSDQQNERHGQPQCLTHGGQYASKVPERPALLGSGPMAGDTISFARGAPSADILPHEQVREAAARALASDWETALSYGVGIGHPGLCQWVAERHGGPRSRRR